MLRVPRLSWGSIVSRMTRVSRVSRVSNVSRVPGLSRVSRLYRVPCMSRLPRSAEKCLEVLRVPRLSWGLECLE